MPTPADALREFAVDVVRKLTAAGHRALWAGGCVRDVLLGREPADYDVATNAAPDEVRRIFGSKQTIPVGASFGVILVLGPRGTSPIEVATFRTEGAYLDGRRPASVTFATEQEDAQRRDFTINGMFYDPLAQQLLDYVGGEHDLAARIVRSIGDPHQRMAEDKLRLLRAVRFAARFDFEIDPTTSAAIREMSSEIRVVSAERIAQELRKMLVDRHRARSVQLADELRLLPEIVPELRSPASGQSDAESLAAWNVTLQMLPLLNEPGFELAAATLLHSLHSSVGDSSTLSTRRKGGLGSRSIAQVHAVCRRLRLSNEETDRICWLVGRQDELRNSKSLPLAKLKTLLAQPGSGELLQLMRAKALAEDSDVSPVLFCENYLRTTPGEMLDPLPLVTGQDLIELGLRPGSEFKILLDAVREAQLNEEIATRAEARKLLRELIDNSGLRSTE